MEQPPELAAEHAAAIAAGDAYAVKAAQTIEALKAQLAAIPPAQDVDAAVKKALDDYKASLAAVPYP